MGITSAGVDPRAVVLDRPFSFVIHEVESRIPLFLGRVTDPAAS